LRFILVIRLVEFSATDVPSVFDPGRLIPARVQRVFFHISFAQVGNFTRPFTENLGCALKTIGILSGTSVANPDWEIGL
jgi:hypothetical protein